MNKKAALTDLRRRIAQVEDRPLGHRPQTGLRFGVAALDEALPGQHLDLSVHELVPETYGDWSGAVGFALALAQRRLADHAGPLIWLRDRRTGLDQGMPYGPGLAGLGLDPGRLILVRSAKAIETLWALEEVLSAGVAAMALAELPDADLKQTRRLMLAARDGATPALLLRRHTGPSVARSRWRIASRPSQAPRLDRRSPGRPRWGAQLTRGADGRPRHWTLEFDHAAHAFHLVQPLADRAAAPRAQPGRPLWLGPGAGRARSA
ncbi:MAG: ImuA family protein [Rhodothalassiaceae bacterium]